MKRHIALLFILFSWNSFSQGLKTQGKVIVDKNGEEVLLRGLGPGGWQVMEGYMMQSSDVAGSQHEMKEKLIELMGEEKTETFFTDWRAKHFTKRDVDSLAAWGFNSIRLPMHYNLFTLPIEDEPVQGEQTWMNTGFEIIDELLEWCAPHGIYLILDLHAAPGGQGRGSEINDYDPDKPSLWESQDNKDKTVALWARIAEKYKDDEWIGGYDLINETHWDLPGGVDLRKIYEDITAAIRAVDTSHIIFIEGNWYANDFTGLTPPWDDNMVYSFHKYWSNTDENDLDWVLPLREEHNIPLWMGESGENSNTWFTDAITLFENNNIGWAWWTMRKVGDIDSPYAVDINPGYQKILDYWRGNGPKPTEQETFDGMMQLSENLLVDNSRFRKDVPDAMFRQVQTDLTIPYAKHVIPGIIQLSDYDLGKNGFAYYDKDAADYNLSTGSFQAWNSGWSYRNDGVDIENSQDDVNNNGFQIGFTSKGEWISYTVDVGESGSYQADLRIATDMPNGKFHLSIDDESVTVSQKVIQTGGWSTFTTQSVEGIILEEGMHLLKIHFDDGSINVTNIEFTKTGDTDQLSFSALTAKTGRDEMSLELTMNREIADASLTNAIDQFSVFVNGAIQTIKEVGAIGDRIRTMVIELEDPILYTDAVRLSYEGESIKSLNDALLDNFSNLSVINDLEERYVFPGRVQSEDFDVQVGLATEETTDTGEGLNIGFTDVNDYADYKIFVRNGGDFRMDLRLAAQNNTGSIGFYLLDDEENESEILTVSTPITGGWQTWETISDSLAVPAGIHTLRMKVLRGGFNMNWFQTSSILLPLQSPFVEKFTVYPNPVSDRLFIGDQHADQYVILSLNGREVMAGSIPESRSLMLSHLKEGFYILNLLNLKTGKTNGHNLLITK